MDGYKQEENFGGKIMSKMLKVIAMLLIIAAVVFVAGCANKEAPAAENNTAPAHAEETDKSAVISEENNTSAGMPAVKQMQLKY